MNEIKLKEIKILQLLANCCGMWLKKTWGCAAIEKKIISGCLLITPYITVIISSF